MINKILSSIENISMSKGRFFSDKSFKFDTVFFIARYIYKYINNGEIELTAARQTEMYDKICADFSLPNTSEASNKNYIREGLALLEYGNVISNVEPSKYIVKSQSILDFITCSIENTYIFQYLIAYKTFVNDGLWDKYKSYVETPNKQDKEAILQELVGMIASKAQSVDETNTDPNWANSVTKFGIMVLALANDDYPVSRTLNVKKDKITPMELSANVSGTRSTTTKDNFYTDGFRVLYVRDMLNGFLANSKKEGETMEEILVDESTRIPGGTNVILYGVPGAGKSWTIEHEYMDGETKMERLAFHPDYTYSDFVGQILPKKKGNDISYDFIPGPFTKIMRESYRNPNKKFILAIEEINRGNAPAIFGDIFQLLDRDKNGSSSYKIMNSDIAREMYGDENHEVSIPSNLTLLCTMNTSDQNVFTLDTAFQRRWNMRLIENSFRKDTQEEKDFAAKTILDTSIKWEAFCVAINNQILEKNQNMTSSEDKRLGTHFVSLDDLTMRDENSIADGKENKLKNRRFPEKVIKYLWDDAFKFYRDEIFKGELNSLEKVISVFTTKTKDDRFDIFKDNIRSAIFDENKK